MQVLAAHRGVIGSLCALSTCQWFRAAGLAITRQKPFRAQFIVTPRTRLQTIHVVICTPHGFCCVRHIISPAASHPPAYHPANQSHTALAHETLGYTETSGIMPPSPPTHTPACTKHAAPTARCRVGTTKTRQHASTNHRGNTHKALTRPATGKATESTRNPGCQNIGRPSKLRQYPG